MGSDTVAVGTALHVGGIAVAQSPSHVWPCRLCTYMDSVDSCALTNEGHVAWTELKRDSESFGRDKNDIIIVR